MNKRISLKAHLSGEQIETRYRKAKDAVERSHWQIIWLLAQGKTAQQIAEVTGYSYDWIRCIVHRYNQGDRQPWVIVVMTIPVAASSCQLSNKRSCNGLWMSRQPMTVSGAADIRASWIGEQTGRQVHPQRGWEYLKRLGRSLRVLRPRHAKADPAAESRPLKKPS